MMRLLLLCFLLAGFSALQAQELYVFSDPASNVPARSLVTKGFVQLGTRNPLPQRYGAEVMAGVSKKLMLRAGTTVSNMMMNGNRWEAAYLYGKYRFLSQDGVHSHFRMAAFAEAAYSRNPTFFDEINIQGDVSGSQLGLIATQLKNKTAVSATIAYLSAFRKPTPPGYGADMVQNAVGYSLSAGTLVLPRVYKNYDQLNFNIYAELLGQKALGSDAWFVDLAPAIQFIVKSNTKFNLGYRFQLDGTASRFTQNMFVLGVEHTFFNALKRK